MNLCVTSAESARPALWAWFKAVLTTLAFAGLTSGCILIPTPHYYATGSRKNLSEQSTNMIRSEVDTIEDVLLKLGEPDAVSPDERRMVYSSKKIIGQMFVIGVDTDGSDLPDVPQFYFLDVMLDDKDVVTNREFSKVGTYLKQAAAFPRERNDVLLNGSIGGEKIIIGSRAMWSPGPGAGAAAPESILTTLFRGLGHGFGLCRAPRNLRVSGCLMLTGSNLYFLKTTQWLNEQPALSLSYDSLSECRLGENSPGRGPALVVDTKDNHCYVFDFDGGSAESACNLIQSKIKPTQPGK